MAQNRWLRLPGRKICSLKSGHRIINEAYTSQLLYFTKEQLQNPQELV